MNMLSMLIYIRTILQIAGFAIVLVLLAMFSGHVSAAEVLPNRGWVTDAANVLTTQQIKILSGRLTNIEKTRPDAPQILLVTFPSLGGEQLSDLTLRTFQAWKPGRKDLNNGILVAIAPNDKKFYISVGFGLEAYVTDAKTQAIGDKMRQGVGPDKKNWNGAFVAAIDSIEPLLPTENYDPAKPGVTNAVAEKQALQGSTHKWAWLGWMSVIGLVGMIIFIMRVRAADAKERELNRQRIADALNRRPGVSNTVNYSSSYIPTPSRPYSGSSRSSTTIIPVIIPTSSPSRSRDDDDYSSRSSSSSSWGSSSSDSSSSSSSSSDSYSSGGGDSGGGGGGGDF
jgi:uncharacterized membrane protein YgcG